MPIANIQDAHEVEQGLQTILAAPDADGRARAIRKMFVETLDFDHADRLVPLGPNEDLNLPSDARLLARRGGFSVLYIPLEQADDNRVKTTTASAAAKVIGDQIAEEPLLLFTNRDCDELHIIYPDLSGSRPRLQRMVAHRGQPGRTVVQQVANLWHHYGRSGMTMGEAVRNAFSVEPVTEAFFRGYKAAYDDAVSLIAANIERVDAEQFTQTLFNRLLFVHFVSRKGWLKFNGDTDYLNAMWQDYQASPSSTNLYRDRLSTLFFDGLNNPQSPDPSSGVQHLIGEVPFLNGGLFEETDLDRRAVNEVPDEAVKPLLTDLFNRYNFTVMEATPLDTEVAVDPEMLGKLFEETVNERHSNGAYYTPRPVVAFMCREAIKGYLAGQNIAGLDDHKIVTLVDDADPQAVTVTQAREIANTVASLKAVDPACGSGAFLLGMMQEILALNATLFQAGKTPESLYQQKLDIITDNVYGVDKDGLAISTAMLRLWLSLAVDYDSEGPPAPLPNLDLKLVTGDAIAGPNPDGAALNQDWFKVYAEQSGLRQDIAAYTTAYGDQKEQLKQQVDETKEQLRGSLKGNAPTGAVEWRIDFADVMLNGGFDVVIANPPYVVVKDDASKKLYRNMYKEGVFGRMNLYGLFIQRSLQLLREGGQLQFINPRTLLTDRYFTNLRKLIKQKSELRGVTLIADRRSTFARVLQECILLHLSKRAAPEKSYLVNTRAITTPEDLNNQEETARVDSERVLLGAAHQWAFFIGASEFEYEVFERMAAKRIHLENLVLKAETGKVQFDKYKRFAQPTNDDSASRLIWAENAQRYRLRETRKRAGKEWLSKSIRAILPPNITGAGIVTQRTTANEQPRRIIATAIRPDDAGATSMYCENGSNFISTLDAHQCHYVLAVLNSSPVEFAFRKLNSNTHVSVGELNILPLPTNPDTATLDEIGELVHSLMEIGGVDASPHKVQDAIAMEIKLDNIIGKLYGFTESEVVRIRQLLPPYEEVYGIQ